MGIIPARCTQCGAEIEVDSTKESGVCKYCGTIFITEKAINNYNTYVTHNYAGAIINMARLDKSEYLCPKCRSVDTRAIKLKTKAPECKTYLKELMMSVIGVLFFIGLIVHSIYINDWAYVMYIIVLIVLPVYGVVKWYRKYENAPKEYQKKLYEWEHTYRCLRCGEQFMVDDED